VHQIRLRDLSALPLGQECSIMSDTPNHSPAADYQGIDFDPDALRARYREERDKRVRADGNEQYVEVRGDFSRYVDDPYVDPGFTREPLTDEVQVLIVGGGFGGLLAGARLREAGVESIRINRRAATSAGPGIGTATRARNAISKRTSICRCLRKPATSPKKNTPTHRRSWNIPSVSRGNSTCIAMRSFRRRSKRSPGMKRNAGGSLRRIATTASARAMS
jgi:hypothetical protein